MPWVPWIRIEDDSTTDKDVQQLFRRTRNGMTGKVSDTVKLTSLTPEVSGLIHDLSAAVARNADGLSVREKETAALIVSVYNGCVH
ncbi:MAG: hypothetical protein C4530_12015 [Desulfobacteraceae bacterium]|nr:MAG: hypothetical protein C4530_12015 [Desulfobacteraceae bacterium]